jgi:hypothetical protein
MEKIRGVKGMDARIAEEGRLRVLSAVTERELQPDPTLADVDVGISVARALPGAVALRPRNAEPSRYAKLPFARRQLQFDDDSDDESPPVNAASSRFARLPPARRQLHSDDDSDDDGPPVNAKAPPNAKQSQPSPPPIVKRRRICSTSTSDEEEDDDDDGFERKPRATVPVTIVLLDDSSSGDSE